MKNFDEHSTTLTLKIQSPVLCLLTDEVDVQFFHDCLFDSVLVWQQHVAQPISNFVQQAQSLKMK